MEATPLPAVPKLTSRTIEALAAEPNSSEYALDLHNRGLKAIVELAAATRLRSLDVSFNRLVALENLEGAKELRELRAYSNTVARADGCAALPKLEVSASGHVQLPASASKKSGVRSREARARAAAHPHMSWWWSQATAAPRARPPRCIRPPSGGPRACRGLRA